MQKTYKQHWPKLKINRETPPETIKKLKKEKKYYDFLWQWKAQKKCEKSLKVRRMTLEEMEKYLTKKQKEKLYSLKS